MLGLVTLYINRGIAQGREVSDSADTTPVSTNAFRARKADLSTTTEFSTLDDLTASSDTDTATKNNPEVRSPMLQRLSLIFLTAETEYIPHRCH